MPEHYERYSSIVTARSIKIRDFLSPNASKIGVYLLGCSTRQNRDLLEGIKLKTQPRAYDQCQQPSKLVHVTTPRGGTAVWQDQVNLVETFVRRLDL
jgi:hypothetical protein